MKLIILLWFNREENGIEMFLTPGKKAEILAQQLVSYALLTAVLSCYLLNDKDPPQLSFITWLLKLIYFIN